MRILVVEDHEDVARFIVRGLKEERYAVDCAGTGTEGLSMARIGDYDAIVLDVMLPGMNGFDVAAALRAKGVARSEERRVGKECRIRWRP